MLKTTLALAAALALSTAASALTVASSTNGPDSGVPTGQTLVTNFNTAAGLSGSYQLVTGSSSGNYAAPLGDTSQYLAVLGGNTASLALSSPVRALSLYWGSIDDFNTISFYAGSTFLGSYTGNQIPAAPANGSQTTPSNNRRVTFAFDGASVTRVDFSSSRNAFELDTLSATAVPEPATWAMLVAGMGLVGTSMRARRRNTVTA